MDDGFLQALEKLQLPSTGVEGSYAPAAATPATAVDTRHHHHRNKQQQAATDAVAEQRYDNEQPAAVRRSPPSNSCEILVGSKLLRGRSFIQVPAGTQAGDTQASLLPPTEVGKGPSVVLCGAGKVSSGWHASLALPQHAHSIQVRRSRRSGRFLVCWAGTASPATVVTRPENQLGSNSDADHSSATDKLGRLLEAEALAEMAEVEQSSTDLASHTAAAAHVAFVAGGGAATRLPNGQPSPEQRVWERRYSRAFTAAVCGVVRHALGTKGVTIDTGADAAAQPLLSRKKDLPSPSDTQGVRALLEAQNWQAELIERYNGVHANRGGKPQHVICDERALLSTHLVWNAPVDADDTKLYANVHPHKCPAPLKRVLIDQLASMSECRHVIGMGVLAMGGLGSADRPVAGVAPQPKGGETGVAVQDWKALAMRVGASSAALVARLCRRIEQCAVREWREIRPLYLAGALLTRLTAPPLKTNYRYDVPHIDKANVASYDLSAVLWLNSQQRHNGWQSDGEDPGFGGGNFRFIDAQRDEVICPRSGRCVLFSSGAQHLHQVTAVERGTRWALACWFTYDAQRGSPIPDEETLLHNAHNPFVRLAPDYLSREAHDEMGRQLVLELLSQPGEVLEDKIEGLQAELKALQA